MGCRACTKLGKCVINDVVNDFAKKAFEFDAFIFASPVHYAAMGGNLTSFMDRLFYSSKATGAYYLKPAAGIAVARRAGTIQTVDAINRYFMIRNMPVVSTQYWNMAFGATKEDVVQDEEGMQAMRILGRNMAYFLQCIEAGNKAGVKMPTTEKPILTNFIKK